MNEAPSFLWDGVLPSQPSPDVDIRTATREEFSEAMKSFSESTKSYCSAMRSAFRRREQSLLWWRNQCLSEAGAETDLSRNSVMVSKPMSEAWRDCCAGSRMCSSSELLAARGRLLSMELSTEGAKEESYCPFAIVSESGTVWIPSSAKLKGRLVSWSRHSADGSLLSTVSWDFGRSEWCLSSEGSSPVFSPSFDELLSGRS